MKKYLKKHKSILLSALFFVLLQTSISTILQFQKGTMINRAVNKDIEGLLFSTIILFVLIILEIGFTYSSERLNNLFSFKVTMDLKGKLFRSINSKSIEECRDKDTGHYVSLFNNDLNAIRMDFYESITYIFFLVSRIVFVFIALTFIDFKIAIVALVTCMVPLAIPNIMKDRISRTKAKEFEELSRFTQYISDRFNGHRVIKIFGVEEYAAKEFSKVNKGTQTAVYKSSNLRVLLMVLSMICSYMSHFIALGMSIYFVAIDILNVGEVFTVIGLVEQLSHPIVALSGAIAAYRGTKPLQENIGREIKFYKKSYIPEPKLIENIEFKDYSNTIDDNEILKGINYTFEKGKNYLLVGESGSGKSTILKAINGEYSEYSGEIFINDTPIKNQKLIGNLALIDQEPYIFNGTIDENISLGEEINGEEVDKVLKLLGLDKYSKLQQANEMSGGEKMRVSLARALVRNIPVLLLDEISSSLDKELGSKIEEYLLARDDLTILFVTHKVNKDLIKYYDDIISFKVGELEDYSDGLYSY